MGFSDFYLLIRAWFLKCCFSLSTDLTLVLLISATHNQINSAKAASGKRSKPLPIIVVALLQSIFNTSWEILFTPKWAQHLHPLLTILEGPPSSLTVEERPSHCYCLQRPTWSAHLSSDFITDYFPPIYSFIAELSFFAQAFQECFHHKDFPLAIPLAFPREFLPHIIKAFCHCTKISNTSSLLYLQ